LNHVLNLAVQAFLRKCKVLADDDSSSEPVDMDQAEESIPVTMTRAFEADINETDEIDSAAMSFRTTIWKLRQIAKVCLVAHKSNFLACEKLDLCAT
jgi:hypothetical protein